MTTIKAAIAKFEATQRAHKDFGAADSEPDAVWQRLLLSAVDGEAPMPPRTGEGWELYASSMDCTEAANALFEAALETVRVIESCHIRDIAALKEYLSSYCWRYT